MIASASLGAGTILLGLAPSFITGFAIALFSAILLGSLATTALYATMISQIFDQRRGLMLGLVMSSTGLGVAAIPPFATWLLNMTDWRTTYMVLGGMAFAIAVTNHVLLRHIADDNMPSKSSSTKGEMRHAMRRPVFWLLATFMFLIGIAANTVPIYSPLILSDKGFTPASSAFALSVVGITMIASRVALGFLMDKTSIRLTLAIMVTGPILGSSILLFTQNPALIPVAAAGFGIATGGEYLALSYMIARYFPLHAFGRIYGWLSFALGIGQVVGPTATAAVRRATGSYDPALAAIFFVALITLGVCMLFTSRLSRPAAQH